MRWFSLFLALCGVPAVGCGASMGGESAQAPSSSQVIVDVEVPSAPPPDRAESARPAAPGFGYIWVAGHWDNLDGMYVWKEGRWQQGRMDYEYVRARYDLDSSRRTWIYHRPHWKRRHAAAPASAPLAAPSSAPPAVPSTDGGAPPI